MALTTGTDAEADVLLPDLEDDVDFGVPPDRRAGTPEDAPDEGPVRRVLTWPVLQVEILALPSLLLALAAWSHRNMFVDGYIYLHVVQNILAGNGPVFNAGQRVEAFTSPTWTAILALVGFTTRASLVWISIVLGLLLSVAGLATATAASTRLVRRASPRAFLLPLGAMVFVALPPVWSLATTGLETGLEFAWISGCLALLVRWSHADGGLPPRWTLIVLGLGPLVRPELAVDSIVFVAVILWCDRSGTTWRGRTRMIAWAVALPLIYQVFRMGYYGMLVANTATAKEASLPRLGRGILYFSDFVAPYWLFVPAVGLLLGAYYPLASAFRRSERDRRHLAALLALPTAGFLNACYIVVMGGDYVHARLFMAPYFAACAPVAAVSLTRGYIVSLLVVPWAVLCAASLRTTDGTPWASPYFSTVTSSGSLAPKHPVRGPDNRDPDWRPGPGVYVQFADPSSVTRLQASPAPGIRIPVIATSWIGYEPYFLGTGVQILDLFGLADPLTAHMLLVHRGEITGHEKPLPTPWIAARLTAPGSSTAQLGTLQEERPQVFTPITPNVSGHQLTVDTAWARAALGCPAIADLVEAPSRPLTFGDFLSNMFHATARTGLRIPADPEVAYHQFCGPGTPPQVRAVGG